MTRNDDLQRLKTQLALAGLRSLGVATDRLAARLRIDPATLAGETSLTLTDRQLQSLATAADRSLPELMILGDPDGKQSGLTADEQAGAAAVFAGLRQASRSPKPAARRSPRSKVA